MEPSKSDAKRIEALKKPDADTAPEPVKVPLPVEPAIMDEAFSLTYMDLQILSRQLSKNIMTREQLFSAVAATTTFTVEGVPVKLEPRLLIRLKSRCLPSQDWDTYLSDIVIKQLHDYAGY